MAAADPARDYDILLPDGVQTRFGVELLTYDEAVSTATATMPMVHGVNPFTEQPTLALLALLVDDVGSTVNFGCRRAGWPVTGELALEVGSDAMRALLDAEGPVLARANVLGASKTTALARCHLVAGPSLIATASVRSVYISGEGVAGDRPVETLLRTRATSLSDLMAVRADRDRESRPVLWQEPDPMICNAMSNVHGGIAATALEMVAHAAIANERPDRTYRTGSLHVSFLRPLVAGAECRYVSRALRAGTTMAVADASAIGDDGKTAVIARMTAYAEEES